MPERDDAPLIQPKALSWFVHNGSPHTPLAFVRAVDGGALVIGGKTGSHLTGHAETWWDKLILITSLGYVPIEVAVKRRIVSADWSPPPLSEADVRLLRSIRQEEP